jgi:hypothetical protein
MMERGRALDGESVTHLEQYFALVDKPGAVVVWCGGGVVWCSVGVGMGVDVWCGGVVLCGVAWCGMAVSWTFLVDGWWCAVATWKTTTV